MDSYLTDIVFVVVAILEFLLALRQKPKSKSDSGGALRSSYADRSNNLNDRYFDTLADRQFVLEDGTPIKLRLDCSFKSDREGPSYLTCRQTATKARTFRQRPCYQLPSAS
jgi:hypothetical protein